MASPGQMVPVADVNMLPRAVEFVQANPHERSIEELVAQAAKIKAAMTQAMEVDHHYGKIPGTPKPTLFKPGAEKLCLLFRLDPQYHSEAVAPDVGAGDHLTVKSVCTLWHIPTGQRFGSGEASCSTRESKYAFRVGKRTCPACGAETINKSKFPPRGQPKAAPGWYCHAKVGGCGQEFAADEPAIVGQSLGRVANPDLADSYNTVLKMANKRALVAAVLNVTAASDVFTQDLEDFRRDEESEAPSRETERERPPASEPAEFIPTAGRVQQVHVTKFWTLANKNGWTKEHIGRLLEELQVPTVDQIRMDAWPDVETALNSRPKE